MSTDYMNMSFDLLKKDLIEYIDDEYFDILDEFKSEDIADCVISIAKQLENKQKVVDTKLIKFSDRGNTDYYIRVNNNYKGCVSVSNDWETAVSRTEYYPYYTDDPEDGRFTGLCSLASMINEAWYTLKYN